MSAGARRRRNFRPAKTMGKLDAEELCAVRSDLFLYQRHDFLTLAGFPNQSNSDSRLAKEICHASQCSASPGF